MRPRLSRRSIRLSVPLALLAGALAWSMVVGARAGPSSGGDGLHVGSPPAVLDDPVVKRCRVIAARRMDPTLDPLTTAVDVAARLLELAPVFDAVATCRAALAAYPNEPKVIIAQYNASEALSVLTLGVRFPDSEEQALAQVLREADKTENSTGIGGQLVGFFLGSAYEYGIGTRPDRAAAKKWYAVAAAAGDPISKRELARLEGAR